MDVTQTDWDLTDVEDGQKYLGRYADQFLHSVSREMQAASSTLSRQATERKRQVAASVADVRHPPESCNKYLNTLLEVLDNYRLLTSYCLSMESCFDGWDEAEALVAGARRLAARAGNKVSKALMRSGDITEGYAPLYFQEVSEDLRNALSTLLSQPVESFASVRAVVSDKGTRLGTQYCRYLGLKNCQTTEGFDYDNVFLVLTCVVDMRGQYTLHLATQLENVALPGRFPVGVEVRNRAHIKDVVQNLLQKYKFLPSNTQEQGV